MFVDAVDAILARFQSAFFEPVNNVGFATHWPNLDHLFQPKLSRWNTRVNNIGESLIAFLVTLNDGGCVNARRRSKCIASENRIVQRNSPTTGARGCLAILTETRKIVVDPTEQLEIHEQLIERRVADALTDS